MFGLSTRAGARLLAPSLLALVATGGCALPIPGMAGPVPLLPGPAVSVPSLPTPAAPALPGSGPAVAAPAPTGATADDAGWERVSDRETGDSTVLPGPTTATTHEDGHRVYSVTRAPAGIQTAMMEVAPVSGPVDLSRFEAGVASSMGGRPAGSEPGQVQGSPALAARYALTLPGGRSAVALIEYVQRPTYVLALAVIAPAGSTTAAEQAIRTMVTGLRLGGAATAPVAQSNVATYEEWFRAGWKFTPWSPVRDAASGVSGLLIGAEPDELPDGAAAGVGYRSTGAPGGAITHLSITPVSTPRQVADLRYDTERVAAQKGGTLVGATPTTVGGHPALDARIEFTTADGAPAVILLRVIATDRHVIGLHTFGPRSADRVVGQVQQLTAGMLGVR
jgi:hypothetical protein